MVVFAVFQARKECFMENRTIHPIALKTRLKRLREGRPSDPEFTLSAIRSMADIPVALYLSAFSEKRKRLRQILSVTEEEEKAMTYKEAAQRLIRMSPSEWDIGLMDEAVDILAAPLKKYYEERTKTI